MGSRICIIGAIGEEIAGIKQRLRIGHKHRLGKTTVFAGKWLGHEVFLVRSGIGMVRAEASLSAVCQQFSPALIISIGFAGGLDARLKSGDLLIAEKVIALSGDSSRNFAKAQSTAEETLALDLVDRALRLAGPMAACAYRGVLLTVDAPILGPEQKRAAGKLYSAQAVDMETFALARFARENGTPFLSVRAVSDTVDQELMDLSGLVGEGGEVSKLKAGWHVVTHPGSMKGMLALGQVAKKACANLADFVSRFIQDYE